MPPAPERQAQVAAIVMALAAALILVGTLSRRWVSANTAYGEVSSGLVGWTLCAHDTDSDGPGSYGCEGSWFDLGAQDKVHGADIHLARYVGFFGGLVAAVMVGATAAMVLARKARAIPLRVLEGVVIVAGAAQTYWLIKARDVPTVVPISVGHGAIALMGAALAVFAALALVAPAASRERLTP